MEESRDRLRKVAMSQRRALAPADCLVWSQAIQARAVVLPPYRAAHAVALYSPIQNEVDTGVILDHALASGKKVFYPKLSVSDPTGLARIYSKADLVAGRFGILEPVGTDFLTLADQDSLVLFVPGVSFDRRGNRLGRGGGWYDRVLGELGDYAVIVGLAYQCQMIDRLPAESWDRRVHFIVTENNLIDCGGTSH